jgi:hypothetical protein
MSGTGSTRFVAPLAMPPVRRRTQLKEKAKTRPHKQIALRLPAAKTRTHKQIARRLVPAGSGVLGAVPKGKDYQSATTGGKKKVDVDAYCHVVRGTERHAHWAVDL